MEGEWLGRDGHLVDLMIDRLLCDDLTPDERTGVEAHLADCSGCRARLASARDVTMPWGELPVLEPLHRDARPPLPEPANRPWRWMLPLVVAAAVLFGFVGPWSISSNDAPGMRLKGTGLLLEVWRSGPPPSLVGPGDEVHPGDRVGFRVRAGADGYLLILGVDESGRAYPCHPSRPAEAVPHQASGAAMTVKAAIVMDALLGTEQIVAVQCAAPFHYTEVSSALEAAVESDQPLSSLLDGCVQDEVVLTKVGKRH